MHRWVTTEEGTGTVQKRVWFGVPIIAAPSQFFAWPCICNEDFDHLHDLPLFFPLLILMQVQVECRQR